MRFFSTSGRMRVGRQILRTKAILFYDLKYLAILSNSWSAQTSKLLSGLYRKVRSHLSQRFEHLLPKTEQFQIVHSFDKVADRVRAAHVIDEGATLFVGYLHSGM